MFYLFIFKSNRIAIQVLINDNLKYKFQDINITFYIKCKTNKL